MSFSGQYIHALKDAIKAQAAIWRKDAAMYHDQDGLKPETLRRCADELEGK